MRSLFDVWVTGGEVPILTARWIAEAHRLAWRVTGAAGTLTDVPLRLLIQQGETQRVVSLLGGSVTLPGEGAPSITPLGLPLRIDLDD